MRTATLHPPTAQAAPAAGTDAAVTRFLTDWAVTLLPLLGTVIALELSWRLLDATTWPAAAAVATGWVRRQNSRS